ncbi:MAG: adenine deaminase, partial [Staphylothermus sp.]|nr:adenine deaminase [Staphylothermus sp.]
MVLPDIFKYNVEERINLINTIMGRKPADIVISNVNIVLTTTGEILEDASIVISGKRIAGMGKINKLHRFVGRETIVIDGENNYALPGFIDPHIHIESSLLTPRGFAKLALRHGTTTIVADPHEIGNVLGVKGVELFIEASKNLPLKVLIDIPSCVPATDPSFGLETVANTIGVDEIDKLAMLEGTIGLGEVMDFVSVLNTNKNVLEKIGVAKKYGLIINGHAPLLLGEKLDAYIDAGIWSDHESTTLEEAVEKIRKGMYVFIREGSAWKDLKALLPLLKNKNIDLRLCSFTSDDINVVDLMEKGHMDRIINIAIEYGIDPIKAIQLATIGPAMRLHLEDHIGIIGPARLADIVLTKNIEYIEPHTVIANGEIIY